MSDDDFTDLPIHVDPMETQRQATAVNHLLGEIGLTRDEQHAWWNLAAYEELRGRTPTQAWLAGETNAVRTLVEGWYAASRDSQRRAARDPEIMAMLRRRLAELDDRDHRSDQGRRSA